MLVLQYYGISHYAVRMPYIEKIPEFIHFILV